MIHHRHALTSIIALTLTSALVVGCSPAPEPTPTPTAAFASEEEAFAAAEETYRAYIEASNAISLQDPQTFEAVERFTTGSYQADERKGLSEMHAEGYVSGGDIKIEWFKGTSTTSRGSVRAIACNDVSQTTLVDSNGVSLVAVDRPAKYALDLTFALVNADLRIVASEVTESKSCAR